MDELKKLICEKFGIDAAKADGIIETVLGFVKDKLPDGVKGLVDGALQGDGSGDIMDKAKDVIGGLFK